MGGFCWQNYRKNFVLTERLAICSEHFTPESFNIRYPLPGHERRLLRDKIGIIPTIYKVLKHEVAEWWEINWTFDLFYFNAFNWLFSSDLERNINRAFYIGCWWIQRAFMLNIFWAWQLWSRRTPRSYYLHVASRSYRRLPWKCTLFVCRKIVVL